MKDIPLNVQTTINSASVNFLVLIFLLMVQFSHKRAKIPVQELVGQRGKGAYFQDNMALRNCMQSVLILL